MEMIKIENVDILLSDNFNMLEFFDAHYSEKKIFYMPLSLIRGCQVVRDYFGVSLSVSCSFAPWQKFGYHRLGCAVDLVASSGDPVIITKFCLEAYKYQKSGVSELIKKLRRVGVEGFGLENNNCIHLDWRSGSNTASVDAFGRYIVFEWINDGSKFGNCRVVTGV